MNKISVILHDAFLLNTFVITLWYHRRIFLPVPYVHVFTFAWIRFVARKSWCLRDRVPLFPRWTYCLRRSKQIQGMQSFCSRFPTCQLAMVLRQVLVAKTLGHSTVGKASNAFVESGWLQIDIHEVVVNHLLLLLRNRLLGPNYLTDHQYWCRSIRPSVFQVNSLDWWTNTSSLSGCAFASCCAWP